ncbi:MULTISPECIES: hypothetical protein [Comamonas]|uniref:hypothetical protein n=1 Tax=Comamonas TaxID=283 RepID=UPI0015FB77BF|nr:MULTISPECIES: hypothetical protein [Comamonas]UUC95167.1 hypothetical protein NOX35_07570 [Comamonas sp. C11]
MAARRNLSDNKLQLKAAMVWKVSCAEDAQVVKVVVRDQLAPQQAQASFFDGPFGGRTIAAVSGLLLGF